MGRAARFWGSILIKCSLITEVMCCSLSCIEAKVLCRVLNLAWIDSAPCSPKRPNPACQFRAHSRVWSSRKCIFGVIEASGNDTRNSWRNSDVACSIKVMGNLKFVVLNGNLHIPRLWMALSSRNEWSYMPWHFPNNFSSFLNCKEVAVTSGSKAGWCCAISTMELQRASILDSCVEKK